MSGIAGILHLDGRPAGADEIGSMIDVLAHRGNDGTGTWYEGTIALGSQLLHVTPESLFEEPLTAGRAGELRIVADLRIDNREYLINRLGLESQPRRPITDPELVLAAYERWGERCPEHLLGDFAFAIWDSGAQRLFLARDHFGVKPLFYVHLPGRVFAFASEIKAVLDVEGVSDALDEMEVATHLLVPVEEDAERTYFRDVRRLTPAHSLTVEGDSVRRRRYWQLDLERDVHLSSDEAYAEAFREVFEEAVRCRLRSTAPVGSMLSGGLDSSSIASVASRLRGGDLPTYSAVFPDVPRSDETRFIDAVVERYNLPSHRFRASDASPLLDLDERHWYLDMPLVGGNFYVNWTLYRTAGSQGTRVVLDGFDGDTTVSHGLGYLYELRAQRRIIALAREVKAYSEVIGMGWRRAVRGWTKELVWERTGIAQARRAGKAVRDRFRPVEAMPPEPPEWRRLLRDDFVQQVESSLQPPARKPTAEREHHRDLLVRPLLTQAIEMLDAAAAAAGAEARLPFCDRRLVEFCLALPPQQKLSKGWSRFILRNAMGGILPEEVRWRGGKTSLEPSFQRGLRHFEEERIRRFGNDPARAGAYLNADVLEGYVARYLAGTLPPKEELCLWRALSLDLWLRREPKLPSTARPETHSQAPLAGA